MLPCGHKVNIRLVFRWDFWARNPKPEWSLYIVLLYYMILRPYSSGHGHFSKGTLPIEAKHTTLLITSPKYILRIIYIVWWHGANDCEWAKKFYWSSYSQHAHIYIVYTYSTSMKPHCCIAPVDWMVLMINKIPNTLRFHYT